MNDFKPVWLVWALDSNGIFALRAICTTQDRAMTYKKTLEAPDNVENITRAYIEKTQLDHCFGQDMLLSAHSRRKL